jgi:hypothetical protein
MDLHPGDPMARRRIVELPGSPRAGALSIPGLPSLERPGKRHDRNTVPDTWDAGDVAHVEKAWPQEHIESPSAGSEEVGGLYDPFERPPATPGPRTRRCSAWYSGTNDGTTKVGAGQAGAEARGQGRRVRRRWTSHD